MTFNSRLAKLEHRIANGPDPLCPECGATISPPSPQPNRLEPQQEKAMEAIAVLFNRLKSAGLQFKCPHCGKLNLDCFSDDEVAHLHQQLKILFPK